MVRSFTLSLALSTLLTLVSVGPLQAVPLVIAQEQLLVAGGQTVPITDLYLRLQRPENKLGVFTFGLVTPSWGQILVGPTYTPTNWLRLSTAVGVEQAEKPWRAMAAVRMSPGRYTWLTVGEVGGSGWWYKSVGNIQVVDWLGVGFHSQRFLGTGPRLSCSRGPATLWVVPAFSHEASRTPKLLAGLEVVFQ